MTIQRYDHIMRPDCPLPSGASVVAYCRDSGNEDQERSVSQQQEAIREYCAKHSLVLERIYTDTAKSGGSAETRTALNEMLSELRARFKPIRDRAKRAKQADSQPFGLVVWKSNRLSRDSIEATHIKSDLRMRSLTIVSLVNQGETGDAGLDALIESLQQYQDEKALEELSGNVKRGLAQLISIRDTDPVFRQHNPRWPTRDGRYIGIRPGAVPVGYKGERVVVGVNRRGEIREVQRIVPDPEKWEAARLAWEMRHGGAGISDIHHATRLFKYIAGYTIMFRNRLYTGDLEYSGKVYKDFVPALIPREWWEEEQANIGKRAEMRVGRRADPERHPRRVFSRHLLSGLLVCTACGVDHKMHGESIPARRGRGQWDYYICDKRKNTNTTLCSLPRISAKALEKTVIDWLMENVLTVEMLRPLAVEIARDLSAGDNQLVVRLDAAKRQLETVRRAIEHLLNMIEKGGSSALETRLRKREGEERNLHIEIAQLQRKVEASQAIVVPSDDQIKAWVDSIRAALTGNDIALIRHTLRLLVHRVEVTGKQKAVLYYAPPMPSLSELDLKGAPTYTRHYRIDLVMAKFPVYFPRRVPPKDKIIEAKRLVASGLSCRKAGKLLGVSKETVRRWINSDI